MEERATGLSDEVLNRFKDSAQGLSVITMATGTFLAFVSRLEAAERKNKALEAHHDADNDGDCFKDCPSCKEVNDADQAWRQEAGKSNESQP